MEQTQQTPPQVNAMEDEIVALATRLQGLIKQMPDRECPNMAWQGNSLYELDEMVTDLQNCRMSTGEIR